ncbi:Rho GTPase activation protein [Hortaea werneckii]|uniref:CRAL-TRIO domain-containing protein n=1 Tax=Hortaea werneckii TaxID=91943 RepID=A0A3M7IDY5_HORWE|nr:Rho GTPase activation protein [Hortaea werneckii]KAI6803280.1 Rho GTPase activation protein [Hortaea werneckii]KAI6900496.1 Rho GTPase activation protein [Hortaea werneckii]KAI6923412.1 Rho GTPase activation protein [Hortaea werneckii]KAI6956841.1 Rho GTPase activation protein [Hortaea werneckii]
MRSALNLAAQRSRGGRSRSTSLSTVPPAEHSDEWDPALAAIAASILYRSPLPSREGRPVYILNAAAFPDSFEVDYDTLLSYVLARLPEEDELLSGTEYEIIFFAGGQPEGATSEKKNGPGIGWYLQAYHVLSRATRKKLQRLYIVHPRTWVRVLVSVFGTVVSPKFRRKITHINTLTQLALEQPIYRLLIPPTTYIHDRKLEPEITVPYPTNRRAFNAPQPFPGNAETGHTRLPRVLRETTTFILHPANITTEGLFRIPPHSLLSSVLKEAYDRGQMYIIWKERGATFSPPGTDQALIDEIRLEDAYGVHLAASIIKTWYRDLRDPVFPESSYALIRERYGANGDSTEVPLEDLVDLLLPASPQSPLAHTAREVLTRHLLPLLSRVASHESQNKMSSENLAIVFSMCLVNGSDQLEDARVSMVIRKILKQAIEMWPVLREGMGMQADRFEKDLEPPVDPREYEDPVLEEEQDDVDEEGSRTRSRTVSGDGRRSGSKSGEEVFENAADEKSGRRRRSSSHQREWAPALPPRPQPIPARSRTTATRHDQKKSFLPGLDVSSPVVKRKPVSTAASSADSSPSTAAGGVIEAGGPPPYPPQYSTVFDSDGRSLHHITTTSAPVSAVPGMSTEGSPTGPYGAVSAAGIGSMGLPGQNAQQVPRRKNVGRGSVESEHMRGGSDELGRGEASSAGFGARSASDGARFARLAAAKAGERGLRTSDMKSPPTTAAADARSGDKAFPLDGKLDGTNTAPTPEEPPNTTSSQQQQRPTSSSAAEDPIFRKPSLPASATAINRPPLPQRPSSTVSQTRRSSASSLSSTSASLHHPQTQTLLPLPHQHPYPPVPATAFPVIKPRTPSPGLLKRMESMEAFANGNGNTTTGFTSSSSSASFVSAPSSALGADGFPAVGAGGVRRASDFGATGHPSRGQERDDGVASGGAGGGAGLLANRFNLKKASVDDLRRLYEDRGRAVEGLKVVAARSGSGTGVVGESRG